MPKLIEIRQKTKKSSIFTKLDLAEAYHQILVKKESRKHTAFQTKFGVYEYTVMPFGLTNAAAQFQKVLSNIIGDLFKKGVACYLDDIIIQSEDKEEHNNVLCELLRRLNKNSMKLNVEKCKFFKNSVEFLGHIWNSNGITLNNEKIEVIDKWKIPTTKKDLQRFLGFINYCRSVMFVLLVEQGAMICIISLLRHLDK